MRTVVKLFSVLLFVLFHPVAHAQKSEQVRIDSMLRLLPRAGKDTTKVMLLSRIAGIYHTIDPVEGIRYASEALELANELRWKTGVAESYSSLGLNYQFKSDYPKASEYDFKALKLYGETGDKRAQANVMRNIAAIYQYEKAYDKVLEYTHKAVRLFEEVRDTPGMSSTLVNLGIFYFSQADYNKALEYDFKALELMRHLDKNNSAANLGNIGNTYMYLKDYTKSQQYSFMSLRLFEAMGDKYGEAIDLGNIGETYLAIAKDTGYKIVPDSLIPAGRHANLMKAIDYLELSIAASREIAQLDNIIEFSQFLSEAWEAAGDYKKALASYREYARTHDSVYSTENSLKIKQSEHIHELELRDRDIKLAKLSVAKKRNERALFVTGICLLLGIIVIIFRNFNSQRKANQMLSKANNLLSDEKRRSDDLLHNILPEEVANDLKTTGRAATKHFENVTVLFTDFVNFTQAGERMSPEELIEELHNCFKAFDEIVDRYNIEKIKTIGDAYLAVSGLPVADPQHAANAVGAAVEIRNYMQARRKKYGNRTFEVRIGIHSGSVVAGIVGVKKFAYDIWGDTVNTAARMEQNSAPGKINISQTTYELVKDRFSFEYRGEIDAKNKGMLKMYYLVAAS